MKLLSSKKRVVELLDVDRWTILSNWVFLKLQKIHIYIFNKHYFQFILD